MAVSFDIKNGDSLYMIDGERSFIDFELAPIIGISVSKLRNLVLSVPEFKNEGFIEQITPELMDAVYDRYKSELEQIVDVQIELPVVIVDKPAAIKLIEKALNRQKILPTGQKYHSKSGRISFIKIRDERLWQYGILCEFQRILSIKDDGIIEEETDNYFRQINDPIIKSEHLLFLKNSFSPISLLRVRQEYKNTPSEINKRKYLNTITNCRIFWRKINDFLQHNDPISFETTYLKNRSIMQPLRALYSSNSSAVRMAIMCAALENLDLLNIGAEEDKSLIYRCIKDAFGTTFARQYFSDTLKSHLKSIRKDSKDLKKRQSVENESELIVITLQKFHIPYHR